MPTVSAQLRAARKLPPLPELGNAELNSEIGLKLREFREKRKLSVDQIAKRLHIRGHYIRALEEGRFSNIPGRIYVDGYIRNYADYLGLNGDQFLASYRGAGGGRASNDDSFLLPEITHDEMKPGRPALLLGLLLLLVIMAAWTALNREKPAQPIADIPSATASSGKALDARIVLLAKSDTLLTLVTPEGAVVQEKLLHGGDTFFVPEGILLLRSETPQAIQFFVDGRQMTPSGPSVISEAGILLDADKLLKSAGLKTTKTSTTTEGE